jgi:excisionase family DNA binding protein
MPAAARSALTPFRPAPRNRATTRRLRTALTEGRAAVTVDGAPFVLPGELAALLDQAVEYLASGEPVLLIPASAELTTGEAAEILGFSRQYLVRLIEEGRIPHRREGAHRRLLLRDVIRYREKRRAEQTAALRTMIKLSEDVGAYDWTEADLAAMDDEADRDGRS